MTANIRRNMWRAPIALAGAVFLLGAAAPATDKQPGISSFLLGNGMEVVVIPDHRAPIVTHMVWYKIGSADEPPGKSGIARAPITAASTALLYISILASKSNEPKK